MESVYKLINKESKQICISSKQLKSFEDNRPISSSLNIIRNGSTSQLKIFDNRSIHSSVMQLGRLTRAQREAQQLEQKRLRLESETRIKNRYKSRIEHICGESDLKGGHLPAEMRIKFPRNINIVNNHPVASFANVTEGHWSLGVPTDLTTWKYSTFFPAIWSRANLGTEIDSGRVTGERVSSLGCGMQISSIGESNDLTFFPSGGNEHTAKPTLDEAKASWNTLHPDQTIS